MNALITIVKDNWEWRSQITNLAIFDIKKKARGAVLGWVWLLLKPLMFIIVFWFALEFGLRAGDSDSEFPYFIWLVSGLVPWFFMQEMIGPGSNTLRKYPYLVNKMKFPLSGISTLYALSALLINLGLIIILLGIYTAYGMPWDAYLLQIPIVLIVMFLFWDFFSIMCSQLSAISRDFANMMNVLQQPFFWMSGVIFDMARMAEIGFDWYGALMLFNPVTFFCTAMRDATYYKVWFWEDPYLIGGFGVVFVLTVIVAAFVYRRFNEEVPDVL